MTNETKKVVAVLNDLLFTVKIQDAAKRAGFGCVFVKTQADAVAQAKLQPTVMIIDLNANSFDALALIGTLKADPETRHVTLLGYVSHVQVELKEAAVQQGCDRVMARSAFVQNLPGLLEQYGAGHSTDAEGGV